MDWSTTLAIVVPNLVAVIAIVVGWKQHAMGLQAGRRHADVEDVRRVLDDAAVALHDAAYGLDDVRMNLTQYGQGFFADEERAKPFFEIRDAGQRLDVLVERLKVRFGRGHEVVATFTSANEAVLTIFRKLELIKLETDPNTEDPFAKTQVEKLVRSTSDEIAKARSAFDEARSAFLDAAQATAGAVLP